ncbi:Bax inhibitor-1/YccA family protein [Clostridium sp. UBA6640]|uniref:Bax inhibitor-1/YccA family protein n=1 Tax=Clostridium sp. UBA6640 TaxID=1946370 RepID=UPI0025B97CF3|nr:Bax inhibitor-1/YccA family protein [Clostridium sp. UBA6640]
MRIKSPKVNGFLFSGFEKVGDYSYEEQMTVLGARNKTLALLLVMIASSAISWYLMSGKYIGSSIWLTLLGVGMMLPLTIVTIISPKTSSFVAPFYAIGEGFLLAGVSLQVEKYYPGIVMPSILLSIAIAISVLLIYQEIERLPSKFIKGVFIATFGIAISYLITFIISLFGVNIPFIHTNGLMGILLSVVVISIAASNLLIDFDFVCRGAESGAPKYMEWYSAISIMVILVWMYLEVLGLLEKIKDGD